MKTIIFPVHDARMIKLNDEQMEELKETIEKNSGTRLREWWNPLLWLGLTAYITGFLLCLTIILMPIGVGIMRSSKSLMYKNYSGL